MHISRRAFLPHLAVQAGWLGALPALAQTTTWIMVPYSAGGPTDNTARKILPLLQKGLGSTVLIENLAGAGGMIGVQKALAAPPDGHMMLLGTITDSVLSPLAFKDAKYRAEDLRMVGLLSHTSLVLLVKPESPFKDVQELVAYAKKPGTRELFYGSLGPGSFFHLLSEDFAQKTNTNLTQVPYKGLAPMIQDLMAGQIDVAFYPLAGNAHELIKEGKVKALGISGNTREPRLPAVPTLNETGLTKGFDYTTWPALFLPARVPQPVAERINAVVQELVVAPEFVKFCEVTGTNASRPMSLAETAAFYEGEIRNLRRLAAAVKLEKM